MWRLEFRQPFPEIYIFSGLFLYKDESIALTYIRTAGKQPQIPESSASGLGALSIARRLARKLASRGWCTVPTTDTSLR